MDLCPRLCDASEDKLFIYLLFLFTLTHKHVQEASEAISTPAPSDWSRAPVVVLAAAGAHGKWSCVREETPAAATRFILIYCNLSKQQEPFCTLLCLLIMLLLFLL